MTLLVRNARLLHPLAFAVYALAAGAVLSVVAGLFWFPLGLDAFQMVAIGVAVVACVFVLKARWNRSGGLASSASDASASELHHKPIWIVLVCALLFSALQNYSEYLALHERLAQLNGDVIAEITDVQDQLLQARYSAENLDEDLADWANASEVTRNSLDARVSAVITSLDGRVTEANTRLQRLLTRLNAIASSQPGQSLSRSTLTSVRNLTEGAVQETAVMNETLLVVQRAWEANRSTPAAVEPIRYAVNPRLWVAIDTTASSAQRLAEALPKATAVPVGDLLVVIAVLNLSAVLFPWLLLLLFVSGRRDGRLRQIYLDLWELGGRSKDVLVRVLDTVDDDLLRADGYKKPEVRRALEDRTFSDVEYLLCMGVLTILLTAGWHMVLYPMGALGLAQLVVSGVSVRDFAMYVVGNLNVITLGFLGAYFYSTGVLIRRFFASDLYPSAFLQMIFRMIVVFVISLVLTILVPIAMVGFPEPKLTAFSGLPASPNGGQPLDGVTAVAGALAFFFGVWTRAFYSWTARIIASLPFVGKVLSDPQASVSELQGVDLWIEGRLDEEGIETVQAMATVAIERLVRRTYFSTARIVGWVDQALLYEHAGNAGELLHAFRSAGIHKATDLIGAVGYDHALHVRNQQPVPTPVDLESVRAAVDTLVAAARGRGEATASPLGAETIFEVCAALWHEPNLKYLRNFYAAHAVSPSSTPLANGMATAPRRERAAEAVGP